MPLVVLPFPTNGFQAIDFKARFRFRNAAMAVGGRVGLGAWGWDEGEAYGKKGVSFKIEKPPRLSSNHNITRIQIIYGCFQK